MRRCAPQPPTANHREDEDENEDENEDEVQDDRTTGQKNEDEGDGRAGRRRRRKTMTTDERCLRRSQGESNNSETHAYIREKPRIHQHRGDVYVTGA